MVYPITLISELSQYMDKTMMVLLTGYGKQVFGRGLTERARSISAFITPSGLFEWLRMPFGSNNAPQNY